MNKHKKLVVFLGILLAVVLVAGGLLIWGNRETRDVTNAHIHWYDSEAKEFTLTTVEELYGLAILSNQYDFGGQTVYLGADIALNSGDASSWVNQPPANVWTPVKGFAGTFDGQGYTISGIYAVGVNSSVGLFTDTKASAKIQNLRLENSFIKGMSDKGTGSIIGSGAGTLENIYANAIVECQSSNCGGLVGFMREGKTNLIQNCWFDGSVQGTSGTSSYVGGIVGRVLSNSGIPKIAHCLNTADVSAKSEYAGGFVGAVVGESSLWIVDSLSLGDVHANEGTTKVGMAVGSVFSQATLNLQTSWVAEGNYDSRVGEALGQVKGVCGARTTDMLQDTAAYTYTTLDFDKYWAARKNETPVLQSFSEEKLSLADVEKLIDVSWFDETATTLHIKDVAQFYGFQFLSQAYSFSGQILFLDADLTLNSGDAQTWEKNAPKREWAPIGRHVDEAGKTIGVVFAGTFDGQGHTISGIYMDIDSTKAFAYGMFGKTSGTIKNLSLKNSYIGGIAGGNIGSVAASFAGGKMDSVYSNAIVHVQANHVGGLVGRNESTAKFTNCWFDGDVIGNERVGGIMGSMNNNTTLEIYHCLNSGKIHANSYYAGGLSGLVSNGTGVIEDSLNVGMISTDKGAGWSGGITGVVNGKAGIGVDATLKDVYTMMGTYKQMYGMNGDEHKITGPGGVILKEEELTGKNAYLWANLNFEEYWTVTEKGTPILKTFAEEIIPVSGGKLADVSWYSVQGKSFNIDTAAKLRGLMLLSRTNDFKGQTINLTRSISISGGNWKPIGTHVENNGKTMGKAFAGTFNGKGNKISGLTIKLQGKEVAYGLFGQVSGTVKNLSVTDSKITGTATSAVGTVAGALRGNGKLENIYSNAQVNVIANYVGGIVGKVEKDSICSITNCWNDGEVSGKERVAGIVGYATSGTKLTISHCLNTQQIYATSTHYTAGICGLADQCIIEITDCLNTGAIICPEDQKLGYSGAILGAVNGIEKAKGKSTINHAYYLSSSCTKGSNVIAANAQYITANGIGAISVSQPRLTDKAALQWTTLDFANYWSVVEDGAPSLAYFMENPTMSDSIVDVSWYDASENNFTIMNKDQLLGLRLLSQSVDFAGKTVTLGADIDLAGESWLPIGLHVDSDGSVTGVAFAGTFDGNGKSITGMHASPSNKAGSWGLFGQIAGTVKNLTVSGTIEGTANQVGGVAGAMRNGAKLENVTSNVNMTIIGTNVGGITGRVEQAGDYTISGCSYGGTLSITGNNAGGILGNANVAGQLTISNCMTTANAQVSGAGAVGGIVGTAGNSNTVTISGCDNAATVNGNDNVGGIAGINGSTTLTIENCDNTGAITAATGTAGGVLGQTLQATVTITGCSNTGTICGATNAGGIAGKVAANATVTVANTTNSGTWYSEAAKNFTIATSDELLQMAELAVNNDFAGKTVNLAANVNLTGIEWTPIGLHVNAGGSAVGKAFAGTFNGNGKSISGMHAAPSNKASSWGFFGQIAGTLKNFTVSGSIVGTGNQMGGVTAALRKGAALENVTSNVDLTITGTNVGGITGRVEHAGDYTISGCTYGGTLSATGDNVGGILGNVNTAGKVTINNCTITADAQISGKGAVGGIIGNTGNNNTVAVTGCTNNAVVTGTGNNVGGIVGYNGTTKLTISGCNNHIGATISGAGMVSGILGQTAATKHTEVSPDTGIAIAPDVTITGCNNYGDVNGTGDYVGGIIGIANQCALVLENSHNGGSVATTKNTNYRGAIAGGLHGTSASRGYITFTGVTYLTGTCSQSYFVNPNAASGGHIDLAVDDCIEVTADGTPVDLMKKRSAM